MRKFIITAALAASLVAFPATAQASTPGVVYNAIYDRIEAD